MSSTRTTKHGKQMPNSLNDTLVHCTSLIDEAESIASKAVQKRLVELGMEKKYAELYSVNSATGGEWILDCECDFEIAMCNIMMGEDVTLDIIREHIYGVYGYDTDLTEIGL